MQRQGGLPDELASTDQGMGVRAVTAEGRVTALNKRQRNDSRLSIGYNVDSGNISTYGTGWPHSARPGRDGRLHDYSGAL